MKELFKKPDSYLTSVLFDLEDVSDCFAVFTYLDKEERMQMMEDMISHIVPFTLAHGDMENEFIEAADNMLEYIGKTIAIELSNEVPDTKDEVFTLSAWEEWMESKDRANEAAEIIGMIQYEIVGFYKAIQVSLLKNGLVMEDDDEVDYMAYIGPYEPESRKYVAEIFKLNKRSPKYRADMDKVLNYVFSI